MFKKIFKLIKKIVFSCLLLYSYNLIAEPLNIIIPINLYTISALVILGAPALLSLIIILIINF